MLIKSLIKCGRQLTDICKYTGLHICSGRLTKNAFTCYKHNGESIVDYLLATFNATKYVSKINIADKTTDSDYCATTFDGVGNQNIQSQHKRINNSVSATVNVNRYMKTCIYIYENYMKTFSKVQIRCQMITDSTNIFIACYDGGTPINISGILGEILNVPIRLDKTSESLKRLKNNKATGTDAIPSEFNTYSDSLLIDPLTALFNYVFECGFSPGKWCEGLVNPLHKQGEINEAENYRRITVTSVYKFP